MLDYVIIEARRQPQNEVVLTKRIARNQRFTVGRTDAADLVLDDPEISSVHFLVAVGEEECSVTDQNSTNKTWYNGQPITQIKIGDGESIRCGKTDFVFQLVSTNDNPFLSEPFFREQSKAGTGIETVPIQNPALETTPVANRSPAVKPVQTPKPTPEPTPIPVSKPVPPAPVARKPASPAVPKPKPPEPAPSTDSGDMINWSLFVEEKPGAGKKARDAVPAQDAVRSDTDIQRPFAPTAERSDRRLQTGESEKTRIIDDERPVGDIVKVMIGIAGQSDASKQLIVDPLQNSKVVMGRASLSQLSFPPDPFMSNRHFEIEVHGNQCLIRDLTSRNGTSLNGQQILIAPLRHGDRIIAGKTDFDVVIEIRK